MNPELLQIAASYGPLGLIIGFLLIERIRKDIAREKLDATKAAERIRMEEKRTAFDRERLEADKMMAGAISAMTAVIQGLRK